MRRLILAASLSLLVVPTLAPRLLHAQDGDDWVAQCYRNNRNNDREVYCEQREVRIAVPSLLKVVGGQNGPVSVRAWDGNEVLVRERIQAWAGSREEARQLAAGIRVHTAGGDIYADGPDDLHHRGYAVGYEIFVPRRMDLDVETSNGPLGVNGVTGRMNLRVQNGPLALRDLGGDVHARAQNGPLAVSLSGTRWSGAGLDAETINGPVTLYVPASYNASLTTGTVNGPMSFDLPVTVQGHFPRQFTTQLGAGGAPVRVVATNGPLEVRRR